MSWQDFQRLKPCRPSMGMMLETTSTRLFTDPHGAHFGSPDKDPAVRLRVLEDAGRSAVPFTTGILIGIGETLAERVDSLFAIRRIARTYHGIQEVIIQNFRAKPDTAMARMADAELADLAATVAVARLVLGPKMRIQAPPNLIDDEYALLIAAGIDDWGGVSPITPDHVNPERPWPQHRRAGRPHRRRPASRLAERLTIYPEYVRAGEPWLDPRVLAHVHALADAGRAGPARTRSPIGRPWQEPDEGWTDAGRVDLHTAIDAEGRTDDRRSDFDEVYGDWDEIKSLVRAPERIDRDVAAALRHAEADPAGISDADALALFSATGPALDAVAALADSAAPRRRRRRRHLRGQPEHQLHQCLLHRLPVLRIRAAAR